MPINWQVKFVELLDELDDTFEWRRSGCYVKFKDIHGRFMEDNLADYDRGHRIMSAKEIEDLTNAHNDSYSR